jgi:hypothetical protein
MALHARIVRYLRPKTFIAIATTNNTQRQRRMHFFADHGDDTITCRWPDIIRLVQRLFAKLSPHRSKKAATILL